PCRVAPPATPSRSGSGRGGTSHHPAPSANRSGWPSTSRRIRVSGPFPGRRRVSSGGHRGPARRPVSLAPARRRQLAPRPTGPNPARRERKHGSELKSDTSSGSSENAGGSISRQPFALQAQVLADDHHPRGGIDQVTDFAFGHLAGLVAQGQLDRAAA